MVGERRLVISAVLITVALGLAACTAPDGRTVSSRPPVSVAPGVATPTSVPPLPVAPPSASRLPGTLLVRTESGGLEVMRPDGSRGTVVVEAEPGSVEVITAAWAPDGMRIAWSQLDAASGVAGLMVWSDAAGGHRARVPLPFVPFYVSWDPTSSRVAFLGGVAPFSLGILERTGGQAAARRLAEGAPFYFSWAPEGDRMVTHVAERTLDTLTLKGASDRLEEGTGPFQAPVWTSDGAALVYAGPDGDLVALTLETGKVRSLAPLDGGAYLVVSPDGSRVAFHARGLGETDFSDAGLAQAATDLGVRIVPVAGGAEIQATEVPAMAWSWSPDGRRLAILEPVYGGGRIRFRWVFWSDAGSFDADPFDAGSGLLEESLFFSQFAQSSSIWAPDSSAIAYPVLRDDGTPAIEVQPANEGAEAYPVARGVSVVWSPTA